MRGAAARLALLAALAAGSVLASEVSFQPVTLESLLGTRIIVQAVLEQREPELQFRALSVLAPGGEMVSVPLHVIQASTEAGRTATYMAQAGGVRRSPLVNRLTDAALLKVGERYVLFLRPGAQLDEYVLEAENAFVEPARMEAVLRTSPRFRWTGVARNGEAGPLLLSSGHREWAVAGLTAWPAEVDGKEVQVTGYLVQGGGEHDGWSRLEQAQWKRAPTKPGDP